ncbi:MAG: hypothetical protein E7428_10345 [Ruminococcaceae bacterium]|nr:hypothetical protein [Oscillospiraceae bacterium]
MGIRSLFTVPEGEKVTEKHLRRVLISSVCSILLCMACLVSATWAWFYVDLQNKGNVIQIGTPSVVVEVGETEYTAGTELTETVTLSIIHANTPDDMNRQCPLYVTLTIKKSDGESVTVVVSLDQDKGYKRDVTIDNEQPASYTLSWTVSWFPPANETLLTENTVTLTEPETVEEDKSKEEPENNPDSAAKTEGEGTQTTGNSTDPTSQTTDPTSQNTDPTSQPAEPTSQPTEPTSQPTEPNPTE